VPLTAARASTSDLAQVIEHAGHPVGDRPQSHLLLGRGVKESLGTAMVANAFP
jgi:hypothetical protein